MMIKDSGTVSGRITYYYERWVNEDGQELWSAWVSGREKIDIGETALDLASAVQLVSSKLRAQRAQAIYAERLVKASEAIMADLKSRKVASR